MTAQLAAAAIALACLTVLLLLAKWRRDLDRALTGPTRDEVTEFPPGWSEAMARPFDERLFRGDDWPARESGSLARGLAVGVTLAAPMWLGVAWVLAQIPPLTLMAVALVLAGAAAAWVWLRVCDARWERARQALMAEEAALYVPREWV